MTGPFAPHPGTHSARREPSALTQIFRRAVASVRRKPAAPADLHAAGAATHPLTGPRLIADPASLIIPDEWVTGAQQWNDWHDVPAVPVFTPSSLMDTGELAVLDARVDAVLRRPVNGRVRPDQPRRSPVPYTELSRRFDGRPSPEVLRQVLGGLRKLDVT